MSVPWPKPLICNFANALVPTRPPCLFSISPGRLIRNHSFFTFAITPPHFFYLYFFFPTAFCVAAFSSCLERVLSLTFHTSPCFFRLNSCWSFPCKSTSPPKEPSGLTARASPPTLFILATLPPLTILFFNHYICF